MIWGNLLHLSHNMWGEQAPSYSPQLQCDDALWEELTERMSGCGFNTIVIDLGDGVRWDSHPEIAVENAWSVARLRDELTRLRQLGLEPLPKLNFSAGHDVWLGEYARMVSTPTYYRVCEELIGEAAEIFDGPHLFHLGMDEEDLWHQRHNAHVVIRQHELWWEDLLRFADAAQATGARPWIWSDHAWRIPDEYYAKMPQGIVQSNWYYGPNFDVAHNGQPVVRGKNQFLTYVDLELAGFDQIPTASNWDWIENFPRTVAYCREHVAPERLLGFLQTPWKATVPEFRQRHLDAIDVVGSTIAAIG